MARIPASSNAARGTGWNPVQMAFRVLIVDDNRQFLEAARDLLEREGLRVVGVAATSAEALQRAAELRPEVVLVDIRLGGESGFDLARRLAGQQREDPAVILISTYAEADFLDLIAESPARGFLPKPGLSADAIRRIVGDPASGGPPGARARCAGPGATRMPGGGPRRVSAPRGT
jgi:two-component system nitrate/nitrite response regulator NarL